LIRTGGKKMGMAALAIRCSTVMLVRTPMRRERLQAAMSGAPWKKLTEALLQ
jgi:hypothetical protein